MKDIVSDNIRMELMNLFDEGNMDKVDEIIKCAGQWKIWQGVKRKKIGFAYTDRLWILFE